jgi:hypothetical protein
MKVEVGVIKMDIKKLMDITKEFTNYICYFSLIILNSIIYTILLFGSVAAMYLLFLMFPIESSVILVPFFEVIYILWKILYIFIIIFTISFILWLTWYCLESIQRLNNDMKKKRKDKRIKLIKDLVKEMKRSIK